MITDIDKYVSFLADNKLTEHQFLILWLIHTKDENNIKRYKQSFGQFDVGQVIDLINRKWIDDFGIVKDNKQEFNIYKFIVGEKFAKLIIDQEDAYEELCVVYPKFMDVKGTKYPMIKGDPYKNAKEYFKYHKGNKIKHEEAVDITKKYYTNHKVTGNIEDYILNKRWKLLKEELGGSSGDVFETL